MSRKRREYTPEFKHEAVKLVLEQGLTAAQAARDLGVGPTVLARWLQFARNDSEKSGVSEVLTGSEQSELKRLRSENAVLRKEREILKKAAAFFAKETL